MPHLTLVLKSPSKALPAVHQAVPTAPALSLPSGEPPSPHPASSSPPFASPKQIW